MHRMLKVWLIAAALLLPGLVFGQNEVGSYPNPSLPLSGAERGLFDQNGKTVNITPSQIAGFTIPSYSAFSGYCLSNNGTILQWVNCSGGGGGGTLSSVGLTMPSVFAVSNSPLIANGALGVTFATGQIQNQFLATPSGAGGAVGLRTITAADIPSPISANTTGNAATASSLAASPSQCSGGQFALGINANGNANCSTPSGSGNVSTTGTNAQFSTAIYGTGNTAITSVGPGISGTPLISSGTGAAPAYGALALNQPGLTVAGQLAPQNGGTGLNGITQYDLLSGSGNNAVNLIAPSTTTGVALVSNGTASYPSFGAVNVGSSTAVTGTLLPANGGTGLNSFTAHSVLLGESSSVGSVGPSATSGQVLLSNGSTVDPVFGALNLAGVGVSGTLQTSNGGTGSTSLAGAAIPIQSGTITAGDCVKWINGTTVGDAGAACGTGGGLSTSGGAQYDITVYTSATSVTGVPPSATTGQVLISNGSAANPGFSATAAGLTSANGSTIPATAGTLAGSTGSFTLNDCLKVGSTSPLEIQDTGAACGSGSGSTTFQTNGTNLSSATTVNFENSAATNGLTLTFANPSAGNVQLGLTGTLSLAGMANLAATSVIGNTTGSAATPAAVSMTSLQTALLAANNIGLCATVPTGPTNDYSPTNTCGGTAWGATISVAYFTPTSGGSTINGLVAGPAMQLVYIVNAEAAGGSDNITLVNQSSSDTTAANRFLAAGNLVIPPGGGVQCIYFGFNSINRWWCH